MAIVLQRHEFCDTVDVLERHQGNFSESIAKRKCIVYTETMGCSERVKFDHKKMHFEKSIQRGAKINNNCPFHLCGYRLSFDVRENMKPHLIKDNSRFDFVLCELCVTCDCRL